MTDETETQVLFALYHIMGYSSDVDTDCDSPGISGADADIDVRTNSPII